MANGDKWGIFDTKDCLWLGDDIGPKLFDDEMLAKIAAEMADVQLRQNTGRCRARAFIPAGHMSVRDELPVKLEPLRALKLLEHGFISTEEPQ